MTMNKNLVNGNKVRGNYFIKNIKKKLKINAGVILQILSEKVK